jgi:hypothetical protein
MISKDFFYDGDHANRYLTGCVVRYNKEPILIQGANADYIRYTRLDGLWDVEFHDRVGPDLTGRVRISNPELDFSTPALGWVNFSFSHRKEEHNYALSICRTPQRMWKVGICLNSLHILRHNDLPPCPTRFRFSNPGFLELCKSKFPTVEEAHDRLGQNRQSVAFSRRWAIERHGGLLFHLKTSAVGTYKKEGREFVFSLSPEYHYLLQSLQNEGVTCQLSAITTD